MLMFSGLLEYFIFTVPFQFLSRSDNVAYHSVYLRTSGYLYAGSITVCYSHDAVLYHCNPVLCPFFYVAVIFMNVKTNFFGLSILMAYVNCKGHSFYNNVQNDTERLSHPQCSTHECDLSCVKVKTVHLDYVLI